MKKFAYHVLKDSFVGNEIYPLNTLKQVHPELYATEAQKYEGRQKLMEMRNPILHCLWNDVVQFTCLDPRKTLDTLKVFNPSLVGRKFKIFALDLEKINERDACLYTPRENISMYEADDEQYEDFNLNSFQNLLKVPGEQLERWKENIEKNQPLYLWSRTKHFLYRGSVRLSDGEVTAFEVM